MNKPAGLTIVCTAPGCDVLFRPSSGFKSWKVSSFNPRPESRWANVRNSGGRGAIEYQYAASRMRMGRCSEFLANVLSRSLKVGLARLETLNISK